MKKIIAMLLVLAMALALVACGASEPAPAATEAPKAEAPKAEEPKEEAPAAPAEKAPEEYTGEVQLYSTMTEADLDALITCFNDKYPNIEVIVTNGSAGELTTRIDGEKGNPQGDLVWGGMADSDGQAYAGIFEAWVSEYDAENLEGYTSPNGLYSMEHLSTVVFCVNEELEAELGLTIDSYEIERPTSDVHDFYRNYTSAIDGKCEQLIKNCEVRRVLLVMEAAFKSAELGEALKVDI